VGGEKSKKTERSMRRLGAVNMKEREQKSTDVFDGTGDPGSFNFELILIEKGSG